MGLCNEDEMNWPRYVGCRIEGQEHHKANVWITTSPLFVRSHYVQPYQQCCEQHLASRVHLAARSPTRCEETIGEPRGFA